MSEMLARDLTHAIMRHYGYTNEQIEVAEDHLAHEVFGCEFDTNHMCWDCTDENGASRHPDHDEFACTASLMVDVVVPIVEREIERGQRDLAAKVEAVLVRHNPSPSEFMHKRLHDQISAVLADAQTPATSHAAGAGAANGASVDDGAETDVAGGREAHSGSERSTLNGDGPCATCGTTQNPVWFTDDVLWNNVVQVDRSPWGGKEPILCLPCFIALTEERGIHPTGWRVMPEWPWRSDEAVRREVAERATAAFVESLDAETRDGGAGL